MTSSDDSSNETFSMIGFFGKLFNYIRAIFVAITASSATIGGGVVTYKIINNDTVFVEPFKVPSSFEEQGYTSEITTNKILDELVNLNNKTTSAKDRAKFVDTKIEIEQLETNIAGFSFKEFASLAAEFFGKKTKKISGEITQIKKEDKIFYKVVLRQIPDRNYLVDYEIESNPEDIIKTTSLKLLERIDPHVAAALYFGIFRDRQNTNRMIDVVLSNDNPQNHKYSLNLRAQIAIGDKRYDDAWKDINKVLSLDPKFSAAHGSISYLYRSTKNYESALNAANDSINFGVDLPYGYYQKGMILKELNKFEDSIEQFKLSIKYNINFFPSYNQIGLIYMDQNNFDESSKWFVKGIIIRPEFSYNYYNYGRLLIKMGPREKVCFNL